MNMNNIKDKVQDKASDVMDTAKDKLNDTSSEVKKSGKDWINYIQDHPMQSVLFGIIGYFAIRGMCKS